MEATPIIARIFTAHEAAQLFNHLIDLEVEYHKPYLRFNKPVKVPRGQASFTLDETIHYSYKAAGGSPPNRVMDDEGEADGGEEWHQAPTVCVSGPQMEELADMMGHDVSTAQGVYIKNPAADAPTADEPEGES